MKSQAPSNVPGDGNRRKCLQVGVVWNSLKKQSTAQIVNIESPTNRPTRKNDTGHTNHLNLQATNTLAMKFTVPLGCRWSLYGVLKVGCCRRGIVALLDVTRHKTVPSLSPHFPGSILCCTPLNPIQGQKMQFITFHIHWLGVPSFPLHRHIPGLYFGISPPLPSPSYRVRLHYTLFMREISLNRKRNNTTGSKYDTTYGTLFQSINFDFRECTTFLGTKVGCFCFLFFHFCEFFLKFLVLL